MIQDPHLDGDALSYSIKLLDGTVPKTTRPCALSSTLGSPAVSGVRGGMHRRAVAGDAEPVGRSHQTLETVGSRRRSESQQA